MTGSEIIETKNTVKDELYRQYGWYHLSILPAIQKATDEFFSGIFSLKLISLSRNINVLFQGEDYFVTKIRVDKTHEVFFRCSSDTIKIILDNVLGKNEKFKISTITQLEAKIISSFNDYLYNSISSFLTMPEPKPQPKKKKLQPDVIHLTFFIKPNNDDVGAKIIISIPADIILPKAFRGLRKRFDVLKYKNSKIEAKIKVGKTRLSLKEVKSLENGDIVLFDDSEIHTMTLCYKSFERAFNINPNINLIISADNQDENNGGNKMEEASFPQDLWDNIQVDMGAEFEKVKISLGELKNIEQGLVIDIGSVYDNKVTLKVENKTIAEGELVIINDRYGVRIDKIHSERVATQAQESGQAKVEVANEEAAPVAQAPEQAEVPPPDGEAPATDEEFDYSDFELDDEDI